MLWKRKKKKKEMQYDTKDQLYRGYWLNMDATRCSLRPTIAFFVLRQKGWRRKVFFSSFRLKVYFCWQTARAWKAQGHARARVLGRGQQSSDQQPEQAWNHALREKQKERDDLKERPIWNERLKDKGDEKERFCRNGKTTNFPQSRI